MRYCFDIDGTICNTPTRNGKPDYLKSTPILFMINEINKLYDQGHHIILQTARGRSSIINWEDWTKQQLKEWGLKYHELEPMFTKPNADIFIDDKGCNVNDWILTRIAVRGIVGGAFDIIHPGYIRMFKEARKYCNYLVVALHNNPQSERPHKMCPVQSVEDRKEILEAIEYVDEVIIYDTEEEFLSLLPKYDVRILGDDYKDGSYTGSEIPVTIRFVNRDHGYSTTKLKTQIAESLNNDKKFSNRRSWFHWLTRLSVFDKQRT